MNSEPDKSSVNTMKNKIIIIIITALVVGSAVYWWSSRGISGENKLRVAFPITRDVSQQTSFVCESLVSADIIGSPVDYLTDGVEGTVSKGTDKIAVNIKDEDTLSFLTRAALEAGVSEGELFAIMKNTDEELVAILYDQFRVSVNVFALNKKNGLAVWSKARPNFLGYESPSGSIIYLICR